MLLLKIKWKRKFKKSRADITFINTNYIRQAFSFAGLLGALESSYPDSRGAFLTECPREASRSKTEQLALSVLKPFFIQRL